MMLVRVSPAPERKEKRIFECPKCNFVNTVTESDPLETHRDMFRVFLRGASQNSDIAILRN
jgi:hypothetical protein